jgi:hypothetical protein
LTSGDLILKMKIKFCHRLKESLRICLPSAPSPSRSPSRLAWLVLPRAADANERHFTYTYESAVLAGRRHRARGLDHLPHRQEDYFVRFDERLEFEAGLTDALQTAFYLNWTAVAADVEPDVRETVTEFTGVSSSGRSSSWTRSPTVSASPSTAS